MKNLYFLDDYFNSYEYMICYYDILMKQESLTKEAILKELQIPYMTYSRAKHSNSKASTEIISKLEGYFKICPLELNKKEYYEGLINDILVDFYYRKDSLSLYEPKLIAEIEENNYLKPIFSLLLLLVRLVKIESPKRLLEKNIELYNYVKRFKQMYKPSPFHESFTIVDVLYSQDHLVDFSTSAPFDKYMLGIVYNVYALNAYLAKKYELCLYYARECQEHLLNDYNFKRLMLINLTYFACLNYTGEYHKCEILSLHQLSYLSGDESASDLIHATKIHYYTAAYGMRHFADIIRYIESLDKLDANDLIFALLASSRYDMEGYSSLKQKYIDASNSFSSIQNDHINFIIDYIENGGKSIKERILSTKLNIGLKEILLSKYK